MSATRSRVLEALAKFRPKPLDVPELGGVVYVRPLTVAGMARIHSIGAEPAQRHAKAAEALQANPQDPTLLDAERQAFTALQRAKDRTSAHMLMDCLVDEAGLPIFTDADEDQVATMPGMLADRLLQAIESSSDTSAAAAGKIAGN